MKSKNFLLVSLFVLGFGVANAQEVAKGDKIVNLGVGLGTALYSGGYNNSTIPPVSASLEVVIKDDLFDGQGAIGVGGYLGYSAFKSKYSYAGNTYGWKYSNIIIGPRGYLHYSLIDKLDTYAGAMLGYWINSNKEYGTIQSGYSAGSYGGVIFSGFVGARYFFNDNVAGMVELGSGIAYLNLGVALRLK
ncbi:MAG: hypothetical protein WC384_09595 [Prolixibacteraceae bacterium]|jgi:hypothetical protein